MSFATDYDIISRRLKFVLLAVRMLLQRAPETTRYFNSLSEKGLF